jgi:dihydrofolate reductase
MIINMPRISLIAATDLNGGIGKDNALPWNIPQDLARFKAITMGHPIVMGNTTFKSIGRRLPGRLNIVITRDSELLKIPHDPEGINYVDSFANALELAKSDAEVFVIGGSQIYGLALPFADRVLLTEICGIYECDTFFPALGSQWIPTHTEPHDGYSFVTYERLVWKG